MKRVGFSAFVFLALAFGTAVAAPDVRFSAASPEVDVYDFVEIEARVPQGVAGNPFLSSAAELTGELRGPTGGPLRVHGFCDAPDGSVFRIRFMPARAGRHAYTLRFHTDKGDAMTKGVFVARASTRKGPVRVDRGFPFHFVWEGTGEHYFWNGVTAYMILGFPDDADIERTLDRLARNKITRLRVALAGHTGDAKTWSENLRPSDGFRKMLSPWPAARPNDVANPGFDTTRFDLDHFRRAERLLQLARQRDLVVSLIFYVDLYYPGRDPFGMGRAGGEDEQRYYRYAVARLGAFSNVMWDLNNEYRHSRTDAWANQMGALIKAVDPWDHLTSIHGHWDFFLREAPWVDMALYQQWDDCGDNVFMFHNRWVQKALRRPIPQINEEYGYEDIYPNFGCGEQGERKPPERSADTRRRLAWRISMAGGYQTTGERVPPAGKGPKNAAGWTNGLGGDDTLLGYHRVLTEFFTSFPWWRMEPQLNVTSHGALALVEAGERVVVWAPKPPRGGALRVEVGPGTWGGRWLDPRTGARQDVAVFEGPAFSAPLPGDQDWALVLERRR